jgi:outer membrane protein TolC
MIIAILLSLSVGTPDTVALSLDAAVQRALEANPTLQAERADARAAATLRGTASRAFLPSIRADVTGVRSTDPVAAFGLKLRQGVFSPPDFDIDALNNPAAFGGFTTAATIEMPILAPEGWFGYSAAGGAAAARAAGAERMAGATVFLVTQSYVDAQLAARRLAALDTALAAVRAHERQADAMHQQGLVTGLDARLASLHAADVEVRRLAAEAEAKNAQSRLRAQLALPETTELLLTDSLSLDRSAACPADDCALDTRGDLRAMQAGRNAAGSAYKSAWAAQLPRLAAFGTVAHHGHATPWDTGSGDWTVGIALQWNLFPALGGIAAVRKAGAERDAATARYDAAQRQAEVEVLAAERMLAAARAGTAVAARADDEARAALAQAEARYRTGAAPITELLDVQSAATAATLSHLAARRDLLLAQAALEFAYGVHDQ